MNLREFCKNQIIFLYSDNVDRGSSLKVSLSTAGYQTYYFSDVKILQDRLKQLVPQIIVFELSAIRQSLSDFVQFALSVDSEMRFIPIAEEHQFPILAQYNQYGFEDIISYSDVALAERVLWAVDRLTERMLFAIQNRKLIEDLAFYKSSAVDMQRQKNAPVVNLVYPIAERILNFRAASTPEDLIQRYLNLFSGMKVVYFKALPSVGSFVALGGVGVPAEKLNGVGFSVSPADKGHFFSQIKLQKADESFSKVLEQHFQLSGARIQAVYIGEELQGLFAYSQKGSATDEAEFFDGFKLFELVYENLALIKKVNSLQVTDPLTGLFVKSYFDRKLTEEFDRAQRSRQPLSLLKLCLDDFYEIQQTLGEPVRDQILQLIAKELSMNGRKHDVAARTGQNEFTLLLPHCDRSGAMIRAERLRRSIEASTAVTSGVRLSISVGMSEYPSLCSTAQDLNETAVKALGYIAGKGGNRLCAWKADPSHRPDFIVPTNGVTRS